MSLSPDQWATLAEQALRYGLEDRYQLDFTAETEAAVIAPSPETGRLMFSVLALTSLIVELAAQVNLSEEAGRRLISYAIDELNKSPDPLATYRFWQDHLRGFGAILRKAVADRVAGTAIPDLVGVEDLVTGFAWCCGPPPNL